MVPRPITIVDAGRTRELELTVKLPAESLADLQADAGALGSMGKGTERMGGNTCRRAGPCAAAHLDSHLCQQP